MPNGSLLPYLRTQSAIDISLKYKWIQGVAAGMLHLKEEGIVHRDLGNACCQGEY